MWTARTTGLRVQRNESQADQNGSERDKMIFHGMRIVSRTEWTNLPANASRKAFRPERISIFERICNSVELTLKQERQRMAEGPDGQ